MKFSENDNIYEFNALNVLDMYADFVEGTPECMVGVCASEPLSGEARKALTASCDKLELGACAWVHVNAASSAGVTTSSAADTADPTINTAATSSLPPADLFKLIEGLDPLVLIAADEAAAHALGEAYGCAILLDKRNRVFGRTCVAFRNFENMLADPDTKQRAWALLKQLK